LPPATAIARQCRRLAGDAVSRLLAWWLAWWLAWGLAWGLALASAAGRATIADSICCSPEA
jgi:hypothetical protein